MLQALQDLLAGANDEKLVAGICTPTGQAS